MSKYKSSQAPLMDRFAKYRMASGKWGENYAANLLLFDRHCVSYFPDDKELKQEMLDHWCAKRPTETSSSCRKRIYCIRAFVEYLRKIGLSQLASLAVPDNEKNKFIPHSFTESELQQFFMACDNLPNEGNWESQVLALSAPVLFRLLYSSGLRTIEARKLERKDVDLVTGIVSVRHSKSQDQHFIVLHATMLKLMQEFDTKIESIAPQRSYFFPARLDSHHQRAWIEKNFRILWDGCGFSYARPYSLRHCYATTNINSWTGCDAGEFNSNFVYLSKSMGHTVLESTRYYFSLTPQMAELRYALSGETFDTIVPEVKDE
ncbi:MAG: tyrosine-type recombinase/integrase [Sphaerochaeta associata]|uniref:tyrosine-type recombinase/integrase n=1 Tax=Sphaerochaeta associata TaxID=1129264 RepID=UPI002B204A53|nr:tyrosine-type recombinase/integrase [Sphaerochaeta associata]MEA5107453.1 tyrosine-type recombinase/integrase [Sphaerochaeta associata]